MHILVLNCGSSSIKCKLLSMPEEELLAKGAVERVGKPDAIVTFRGGGIETRRVAALPDHAAGLEALLAEVLEAFGQGAIDAVGHRVVHGGREASGTVLIDAGVKEIIRAYAEIAPLHNPPNLKGIEACERLLPGLPQTAVFDTALHATLPSWAYTYALPRELNAKYQIRRYGFHGTAFRFMAERAAELIGKPLAELRLVQLMLGSGTTANALSYGRSIDVSTGLTPTEGLVQSTRTGDLDPLIVTYLMRRENLTPDEMEGILCHRSGWFGLSGVSNDLREVEEAAAAGNEDAKTAIATFAYRAKKYVGAYAAALGGLDAITISGGVGEGSSAIRETILSGLEFLGVHLDAASNEARGGERFISTADSPVKVALVKVDEELVIARDTYGLVGRAQAPGSAAGARLRG